MMSIKQQEYIFVIANAIAYCIVPIYIYFKCNLRNEVFYISILWALSSVVGILYYNSPVYDLFITGSISPIALLFYFVCYLALLYPLLYINSNTLRIAVPDHYWPSLMIFVYIVILSAILPFVENVIELFKDGFSGLYQLGEKYEEISSNMRNGMFKTYLSKPSVILLARFLNPISYLLPILFCLYLTKKNRNTWVIIGLFIASLSFGIQSLARGQRSILTSQLLYYIYILLLFKKSIDNNIYNMIKKSGIIIGIAFVFIFTAITLSRTGLYEAEGGATNEVILGSLARYYGEHFFNYSAMLFESDPQCMGNYCLDFHSDNPHGWEFWDERLGVTANLFYGTIGDLFKDFSLYTLPILILLGIFLKQCKINQISTVVLIFLWAIFLTNGIFACLYEVGLSGFICILIALFLKTQQI